MWRIVARAGCYHPSNMTLAVFDLDGTISHHDTLFPLVLRWLVRRPWRLLRLLGVIPGVVRFAWDHDRGALKQSLLRATLRGTRRADLAAHCERFVTDTIARRCFGDALSTIRRHREAGHFLVLMSASVDFYVPEFGRQLGFDRVLSTGVAWNGDRLDGRLTTPNLRDAEKARRFEALVAELRESETFAYGNSHSDLPHLRLARHGVLVNGSVGARRDAAGMGVTAVEWV